MRSDAVLLDEGQLLDVVRPPTQHKPKYLHLYPFFFATTEVVYVFIIPSSSYVLNYWYFLTYCLNVFF